MYWIVVGDVHESTDLFERIPGVAGAEALILSGDLTNRGGPAQADHVIEAAQRANPRVLAQVGNMDEPSVTGHLAAKGLNIHREALLLAPGLALMGVGYSTITPFGTPSEATEADMAAWLDETHAKAKALVGPTGDGGGRILAVIHNAPHGTSLDRLPNGMSVGSTAVRAFLDAAQPDICVCGHIHEGQGEERLGRCQVLNPGLLADGGFARVDLENGVLSARLGRI
ncbi:MAG TPA: metallophosphoesterase family protein [Humidesulfovibrio sp.]|uniref:metallophosphoesterase family protein n=1 Tax=Humidesulfovibrio sp. TaxID=2910988 RepID=UPI002C2C8BBC|nr:metallophosphoesterase family protein [Humidesulfovibrio sp.]HWR03839.1 metallophosphoesterase family protein [Humidesulfovibrio sp.]